MTVKRDGTEPTPEAQLRSYIDRFDPKNQKLIRSVRAAVRKRIPTANELAYDYNRHFVIGYSPTDRGIDSIVVIAARATGVSLYFSLDRSCPTRSGFCWGRESRHASSKWKTPVS